MVTPLALVEYLAMGVSRMDEQRSLNRLNELHGIRKKYEAVTPRH